MCEKKTIIFSSITTTAMEIPKKKHELGQPPLILPIGISLLVLFAPISFGCVPPVALAILLMLLFLLGTLCARSLISSAADLPKTLQFGTILILSLIASHCLLPQRDHYEILFQITKWVSFFIFFLLIQKMPTQTLIKIIHLVLWLGVFETILGVGQVFLGWDKVLWVKKIYYPGYATGTYFNRNHFAGLLELILGGAIGFCFSAIARKKFFQGVVAFTVFSSCFLGLLISGSRAGVLSFSIALIVAVTMGVFLGRRKLNRINWLGLSGLLIPVVLAVYLSRAVSLGRLDELFFSFFTSDFSSWGGRKIVWENSLKMISDFPWLGVGLGHFKYNFPFYQSVELSRQWSHAHNDYLELCAELGIPTFLLLGGLFLKTLSDLVKKMGSLPMEKKTIALGLFTGVISFLIHGLTDFNFAIPGNNLFFVFFFASFYHFCRYESEK